MELNMTFPHGDQPVWNQKVDGYLRQLPIYLQKDLPMRNHRKKLHTQPGIEINITHHGNASFVVGDRVYRQSAKHIILFPGHYPHQVFPELSKGYERTVLCLNDLHFQVNNHGMFSFLGMNWFDDRECIHIKLSDQEYAQLIRLLQSIETEMTEQKTGWERMLLSLSLEMGVLLQRSAERDPNVLMASSDHVVEQCAHFVQHHLYEDLSLQRVALMFGVSPEHLTRSFRRRKGLTFYQYVLSKRINESKRLLGKYPDKTLTEIAYSLGFSSSSQFSRTFKKMIGESPSDYRQRLKEGQNM